MKEASGELNMTVVTIVMVGAVLAFFWFMWPSIKTRISGTWDDSTKCGTDQYWNGNACVQIEKDE